MQAAGRRSEGRAAAEHLEEQHPHGLDVCARVFARAAEPPAAQRLRRQVVQRHVCAAETGVLDLRGAGSSGSHSGVSQCEFAPTV